MYWQLSEIGVDQLFTSQCSAAGHSHIVYGPGHPISGTAPASLARRSHRDSRRADHAVRLCPAALPQLVLGPVPSLPRVHRCFAQTLGVVIPTSLAVPGMSPRRQVAEREARPFKSERQLEQAEMDFDRFERHKH